MTKFVDPRCMKVQAALNRATWDAGLPCAADILWPPAVHRPETVRRAVRQALAAALPAAYAAIRAVQS